jgi:hypothetical protein
MIKTCKNRPMLTRSIKVSQINAAADVILQKHFERDHEQRCKTMQGVKFSSLIFNRPLADLPLTPPHPQVLECCVYIAGTSGVSKVFVSRELLRRLREGRRIPHKIEKCFVLFFPPRGFEYGTAARFPRARPFSDRAFLRFWIGRGHIDSSPSKMSFPTFLPARKSCSTSLPRRRSAGPWPPSP